MLLQLFHLSYHQLDTTILDNIHLEFHNPGLVLITGPSGSGKSTLLHLIGGIISPSVGEVLINGVSFNNKYRCNKDEIHQNDVSFIFQGYHLIEAMSVYDNLKLFGFADKDIECVLDKVKLKDYLHKRVDQLSGGQKQRIALARAFLIHPKILLADEPTASLDDETAKWVCDLLNEMAKNTLVIVVSHDVARFKDMAERQVELVDGKVVKDNVIPMLPKKVDNSFHQFSLTGKTMCQYIRWSIISKKGKLLLCQSSQIMIIILFLVLFAFYGGMENYLQRLRGNSFFQDRVIVEKNNPLETLTDNEIEEFKKASGVIRIERKQNTLSLSSEQDTLQFERMPNSSNLKYVGEKPEEKDEILLSFDLAKKVDSSLKQVIGATINYQLNNQNYTFRVTGYNQDSLDFKHVYCSSALESELEWVEESKIILIFENYQQVKLFMEEQHAGYIKGNSFYEFEGNIQTTVSMVKATLMVFTSIILFINILMSYLLNFATFLQKRKEITTLRVYGISLFQLSKVYFYEAIIITLLTMMVGSIVNVGVIMGLNQIIPYIIDATFKNLLIIPYNETLIKGVTCPMFPYIIISLLMIMVNGVSILVSLLRINHKDAGQILREDDLC